MSIQNISPELEHDYLHYYSKLIIALGVTMFVLAVDDVMELAERGVFISTLYYIGMTISVCFTLYYLFTGNRFTKISLSKNAWLGTFNDEFLNSANLIAYKICCFVVILAAFSCMIFGNYIPQFGIETMGAFIVSCGFIAYGVTALIQLSDYDE